MTPGSSAALWPVTPSRESSRGVGDHDRGHLELSVSSYAFLLPAPPVLGALAQKGGWRPRTESGPLTGTCPVRQRD